MKLYTMIVFLFIIFHLTGMEYTICNESSDCIPSWVTDDLYYRLAAEDNSYQREVGEWSGAGPWGGNVRSLAVDGSADERMAAGCGFSMLSTAGGVWYSEDSGAHWQASSLQGKPVYAVCTSPSQPGVMWAGARNGLYRSIDCGEMWTLMGFNTTFVIAVGVHQSNGEVIVAGLASNSGIRVTQNGGETWETVGLNSGYMKGFASTPADTSLMVIAVSGLTSAVFRSTNLGSSWEAMSLAGDAYDVEISDSDADLIFVAHDNGVYRSNNGGADWELVLNAGTVRSLVVRGSEIYAAINGIGVYESADNGEEWTLNSNGIVETNWATGTGSQEGVYFGFWGGIYHSSGFDSAYNLYHEGLNAASVHAVAYYADRGELWAVTEGSGIYLSNDLGSTWEYRSAGLTSWTVYNIAPNDHDFYQVERMMVATYDGIFASDDHGNSWYQIALDNIQSTGVEIHPTDPDQMWAGGAMGPVQFTDDGGLNWTAASGLPFAFYPRIKYGQNSGGGLRSFLCYEQMGTAVYYSDNNSLVFSASSSLSGTQYQPYLSVRHPGDGLNQIVYCSTDQGVFKSADYGATFIPTASAAFSWSVLGTVGQLVYSGTDNGVIFSENEGGNWSNLNQGTAGMGIWGLVYGYSENQLFAATRGFGVKEFCHEDPSFPAPQNLIVDPVNAILTWEAPETGELTGYNIYLDDLDQPLAFTIETTYQLEVLLINGQNYTAGVSAVYDLPEGESEIVTSEFCYQGTGTDDNFLPPFTMQNFPNPFNPRTRIIFGPASPVRLQGLSIYNLKGETIREFTPGEAGADGRYIIEWDGKDAQGRNMPSGVYIYRLTTSAGEYAGKMVMMK